MSLIGRGATGTVYRLSTTIAVKRSRRGEDEQADHANEQRIFEKLDKHSPVPYLIQCYYLSPQNTFLELAPNGSIALLLNQHQKRSSCGTQVLEVLETHHSLDVLRWMSQLCHVAAGLEKLGLTHGDIRPANMLLDANWNLKLSDLDRGINIGDDITVLTEPFGRLLEESDGEGAGSYGKAGARTEAFAIGSVYYTLLHGHEPYETESWGGEHFVILGETLQRKQFPTLDGSNGETIIRKCWNGDFHQVSELLAEFTGDIDPDTIASEGSADHELRRKRRTES